MAGRSAALYTLLSVRTGIRLSQSMSKSLVYFIYPAFIRCITSASVVRSLQMIDPRYFKWSTCLSGVLKIESAFAIGTTAIAMHMFSLLSTNS